MEDDNDYKTNNVVQDVEEELEKAQEQLQNVQISKKVSGKKTTAAKQPKPPKPEPEKCSVCFEEYTKCQRKEIVCPYCKAKACMTCTKEYLVSSAHDPHCMFCKVGWSEDYLRDNFTNAWLTKEYSKVEKQRLFERERSLMPQTQQDIEKEAFLQRFFHTDHVHRQIKSFEKLVFAMQNLLVDDSKDTALQERNIKALYNRITTWNAMNTTIKVQDEFSKETIESYFGPIDTNDTHQEHVSAVNKRAFIKPCPAPDCRGFLSSQWACGICQTKVCATCFAVKRLGAAVKDKEEPVHTCKDEDVQTANFIRKDSKNCPKCGVSIHKIEGCNQMFCTNCNTAFSWSSLQIINKGIHNPHYFQWLNRVQKTEGRVDNEITQAVNNFNANCEQRTLADISNLFNDRPIHRTKLMQFSEDVYTRIQQFIRYVLHLYDNRTRQARRQPNGSQDFHQENRDLRRQYLMSQITEAEFISKVHARYTKQRFTAQRVQIIEMLHEAAVSIWSTIRTADDLEKHYSGSVEAAASYTAGVLKAINELALYYNKSMYLLHQRYKSDALFDVFTNQCQLSTVNRSRINTLLHEADQVDKPKNQKTNYTLGTLMNTLKPTVLFAWYGSKRKPTVLDSSTLFLRLMNIETTDQAMYLLDKSTL